MRFLVRVPGVTLDPKDLQCRKLKVCWSENTPFLKQGTVESRSLQGLCRGFAFRIYGFRAASFEFRVEGSGLGVSKNLDYLNWLLLQV